VHSSHSVDGEDGFLGHLLVEVRSEYAREHDLVLAKLDIQTAPCKIGVERQRAVHVGVKPATRLMDAACVGRVADFEGAVLLHNREFRREYLVAEDGHELRRKVSVANGGTSSREPDAIFIGSRFPSATNGGSVMPLIRQKSRDPAPLFGKIGTTVRRSRPDVRAELLHPRKSRIRSSTRPFKWATSCSSESTRPRSSAFSSRSWASAEELPCNSARWGPR
jgi:hypothetical protein